MIKFGVVNPDEDIVYNNSNCKLKINSGEFMRGTLLMTSRFVVYIFVALRNFLHVSLLRLLSEICWKRNDSENGFMIPWEKITVQAITQEPQRCIYFMIDVSWPEDPASNANHNGANGNIDVENPDEDVAQDGSEDEGNDSEGSVQELTEFYIVPDSADDVDEIYYVMTKFPVAEAMDDSDDDDFFDGENMEQMNLNEDDNDRFADAE